MVLNSKPFMIKLLLIVVLAAFTHHSFSSPLDAERPIKSHTKIKFFGNQQGLEQFTVMLAVEDHHGFLWLGTPSGVARFDGSQFKAIDTKSSGLSDSSIRTLFVDSKNRLWVGTERGLNLYNEETERFTSFVSNGLLDNQIWTIFEDADNTLWVSTATGLHVFHEKEQLFEPLLFPVNGTEHSPREIKTIYQQNNDYIWLGSDSYENYILDPRLNKLYPLSIENPLSVVIETQSINQILERDNDKILFVLDNKILQYQHGQLIELFAIEQDDLSKLHRALIDDEGYLWLSSSTGLTRYRLLDSTLIKSEVVISNQAIFGILKDINGNLWFGTKRNGLASHTKSSSFFQHLSTQYNTLSDDVVWGIKEDSEKNIWVSGKSNLVNRLNMKSGTVTDFDTGVVGDKAITFDVEGNLYVGGVFGLYQYDINSADFTASRKLITNKDVAYLANIKQHIYFGAWADGLYRINIDGREHELESILFEDEQLAYITTLKAFRDRLYVGQLNGLLLVDVAQGLSKEIQALKGLRVSFVHIGDTGVYVSTGSSGVYLFNHDLSKLIKHYDNDEILKRVIYAVVEGNNGHVWLSTDKGILEIDKNDKVNEFDLSDGLQALDFNDNSALLSTDGMLFFGGMNGLNYFNSHELHRNEVENPRLLFTELTIFNKKVAIGESTKGISRIDKSIIHTPNITLNYTDYPFELSFNLVNYPQPHKVYYEYMVEGVDNGWIRSKLTQTATYTNLSFGQYTLKVRAFHINGAEVIASNQIAIKVLPPWWLSVQALLAYLFVAIGVSIAIYRVIRQRKLSALEIKQSAERLKLSLWGSGDIMWDWNIEQDEMHLTQDWQKFDYRGLGSDNFDKLHPNDRDRVKRKLDLHLAGESAFFEADYRIKGHEDQENWIWVVDRAKVVMRSEDGRALRMTGTIRDITKFKDTELKLNLQANVMANISDAIYVLDLDFNVVDVNAAFSQITGLSPANVLHSKRIFNTYNGSIAQHIKKRLSNGIDWAGEVMATKPDGSHYYIQLHINPMRDSDNQISHYVAAFSDITQRKQTEEELRNLSNIDPLTNLPNRSYFQYAHRNLIRRKEPHALLTMDVDNFKKVNDSMGHDVGDKLLCMIAERIENNVDCQHLLCRLGGDEFALLLEDIDQISMITQVLYDIEVSMQEPMYLDDQVLVMSCSIGVAIYPSDGETTENMLQSSDTAMYHAKSEPGFSYRFFSSSMNESAVRRLQVESLIRQALKNDWFEVYYQPKIDVVTRKLAGMEALVRLSHPELGMISPNEFIPIAEDTGLVIAIGEKVLDKACYATQQWRKSGLFNGRVAVNLAAKQFTQVNLLERIEHILECTQLPIANLELEITEGTVIENPEVAIKTMQKLTNKGIHLALDDFGTGYSSLSYLKRFPIHTLKIDKAFIDDLSTENGERHMVASIISIAHNMGLTVVAEGVEHEVQVSHLEQLGCEAIQGYFFNRPLSEADFTSFLLKEQHIKQQYN